MNLLRYFAGTVSSGLLAASVALSTYASAKRSRMTTGWGNRDTRDPNRAIREDANLLRERAWQLDRDNPIAGGTTDALVDGVLSSPIRPISAAKNSDGSLASDWNKAADSVFKDWADEPSYCDLTGHDDFPALQDLSLRTVDLSGECLVLRHMRRNDRGVPGVRIEICEPNVLGSGTGYIGKDGLRDGVEYDADLRPVAYQIRQRDGSMVRWDASSVLHLYARRRPGQLFGEPSSARCGESIFHVGEYQSSELQQAKFMARIFGAVESAAGGIFGRTSSADDETPSGHRITDIDIGQILDLLPGEKFTQINQVRPTTNMDQFQARVLSGFAIGRGMTYEQVSGDYARTNYSSAQMSALAKLPTMNKRRAFVRDRFVAEVRFWVIQQAILDGILPVIPGAPAREYWRCAWAMPGDRHIDQNKQAAADDIQLRQGRISISDLHARDGNPTEEQVAKIASDKKLFQSAGLTASWMEPAKATSVSSPVGESDDEQPAAKSQEEPDAPESE